MDVRDFVMAPLVIFFVTVCAYYARPYLCDTTNYRYFFPALYLKIISAIALGLIYTFYYKGGDTFAYHTGGSRIIWNTMIDDPLTGLQFLLPVSWHGPAVHAISGQILFYHDPNSYAVIRLAAIFDMFTFSSYCGTAVMFAAMSFIGAWFLFKAFYEEFPQLHRGIAAAVLFVPSVFLWGSGILKDSITITCLGLATYSIRKLFLVRDGRRMLHTIVITLAFVVIFSVKKYVLLCFVPAALIWVITGNLSQIRSLVLRFLLLPAALALVALFGYWAVLKIGEDDKRYALDRLAMTARTTAYDIRYYTGRSAGSGYSLGELDGTFTGMLKIAPQAINVSLFRPYLWEVKNPFMLLSALEAFFFLILTLWMVLRGPIKLFKLLKKPYVLFCISFAITFAFAVGSSTYNFGTLSRYKIPLLPFYFLGLILLFSYSKSEKKAEQLDSIE